MEEHSQEWLCHKKQDAGLKSGGQLGKAGEADPSPAKSAGAG